VHVLKPFLILALVTLIPGLELRASIPLGILGGGSSWFALGDTQLSPVAVVAICVFVNILLGWGVFLLMGPVLRLFEGFRWFQKWIDPWLQRAHRKLGPYVEKYGGIGVAVFIGVPLPGSGVYTGAVGAYLLGVSKKSFAWANVLGVLIAGTAVTAASLLASSVPWLQWMIKH
jgi:uncharacterized membrane protein